MKKVRLLAMFMVTRKMLILFIYFSSLWKYVPFLSLYVIIVLDLFPIEIRDGDSASSPLIGSFCGYKMPKDIKSASNRYTKNSTQGVTKRCRLSLLTNSALIYESQCGGMGGSWGAQPMSTAVHITWQGAQIYFGDLPPYLTYDSTSAAGKWQYARVQVAISS